jgi:hypothetical protein
VLVLNNGEKVHDSRQILAFADATGDPAHTILPAAHRAEIEALMATFHDKLGPDTRRVGYHFLLGGPEYVRLGGLSRAKPRMVLGSMWCGWERGGGGLTMPHATTQSPHVDLLSLSFPASLPSTLSDVVTRLFANNVGPVQGKLATLGLPTLKAQLARGLGVTRDRMLKSLARVEEQVGVAALASPHEAGYTLGPRGCAV